MPGENNEAEQLAEELSLVVLRAKRLIPGSPGGKALAELERRAAHRDSLAAQVETLREALKAADREASLALDAIWHPSVAPNGGLHDDDEASSASAALTRLQQSLLAALGSAGDET